jgi:8-oxo-dGTP diphosphatase
MMGGRMLVVRKRNTAHFMQPGGKLETDETPLQTLARELKEELGCVLVDANFCGIFSASAANEPGQIVEAALYRVRVEGVVKLGAEIEELAWLDPQLPTDLRLAPLTRDYVVPVAVSSHQWRDHDCV